MISEGVEFRDFDGERYHNLERLLRGELDGHRDRTSSSSPRGGPPGVLALRRGGRVVKVRHTHRGWLSSEAFGQVSSLEETASQNGARWVVVADAEALEEVNEVASARLRVGDDMVDLIHAVLEALGAAMEAGRVEIWPDVFEGVRLPSRDALRRFLDKVFPPRSSFLLYVFDGSRLWAEVVCARGAREIEVIAGHDALECGPPPRRWREEHGKLLAAAEARFGPPTLGIFVSLEAATAILSRRPKGGGELSRAIAQRELIFAPLPPWLAAPLGLLAVRDAVEVGRKAGERVRGAVELGRKAGERFAERFRPKGRGAVIAGRVAGQVAQKVRSSIGERLRGAVPIERVEETVTRLRSKADLSEILGFDPFALAGHLVELSKPQLESDAPDDSSTADDA